MTQLPSAEAGLSPGAAAAPTARQRGWRKAGWAFGLAAAIFLASSRAHVASPGITTIDDKLAHFAVYGLLGTLVCRVGSGWRAAGWALLVVAGYAASDEWHQSFVPGRMTELNDWIADTSGAALAIALYTGWGWYRRLLETPVWPRRDRIEKKPAAPRIDAQ
jgi:VanZ family protein